MQSIPVVKQISWNRVVLDRFVPEREPLRILADLIDWTEIEEKWDKRTVPQTGASSSILKQWRNTPNDFELLET